MDQNNNDSSADAKSFKLYTTKAPILLQLLAGLIWLGSAGLIIIGLTSLLINPISGIFSFVFAAYFMFTGRLMFRMKKSAFIHSIILAVLVIVSNVLTNDSVTIFSLLIPVLILISAFGYRSRYIND